MQEVIYNPWNLIKKATKYNLLDTFENICYNCPTDIS
jgi:hypothetical protein